MEKGPISITLRILPEDQVACESAKNGECGMRFSRRKFLGVLGSTLAGGTLYACGIEPTWLRRRALTVSLPALPRAFAGYRIAQLSDLHVGSGVSRAFLEHAVSVANASRPDLAVVTGDLVDDKGLDGAAEQAAAILSGLRARHGVCAVLGNHDTGAFFPLDKVALGAVRHLEGVLDRAGIDLLENESRVHEREGGRLRVTGLGDLWSGRFAPGRTQVTEPKGVCIALSHNPDTAPELARRGTNLILSGHTHGGQVNLPFFGPPYLPVRRKQFIAGPYAVGRAKLYVNSGLGYSHRIRFRARPEVTILTLRGPA